MRFKSRQVDALKAGSDLEGFFTYHGAKDSWRASSLKSVAAGILLDEFYGDEVETLLLESWNGLIPVVLLVLPWAMVRLWHSFVAVDPLTSKDIDTSRH
jgi:hypothetical protein